MHPDDAKALSQQRFGQFAANYITSERHAKGGELDLLIEMAQPQPGWRALDVATGGGHTALAFAPHVREVVATDLTPKMLTQAQAFISDTEQGGNVRYALADAERLPFAAEQFDLVTCRIAPHHFPDAWRFVQESARVLVSGGLLLVQDHLSPDGENAAIYLNSFERLRDPSHVRAFAGYEWRGMFADADLTVEQEQTIQHDLNLETWAARQANPPDVVQKLHILMRQAPAAVAAWVQPRAIGTPDAAFSERYILIAGRKS